MAVKVWSDIHSSIVTDAQGNIRLAINNDAVVTSIDNILRTKFGERLFLPEFGCNLSALLFNNITEDLVNNMADGIKSAIEAWDDRVKVNAVNFFAEPDKNSVSVKMNFTIRGYDQIFEYSSNL